MKSVNKNYSYNRESDGEEWIGLPNNGGDIGDMIDICNELNNLLDMKKRLEKMLLEAGEPDDFTDVKDSELFMKIYEQYHPQNF